MPSALLFALPLLALLAACNEAGEPAGRGTTAVDEAAAPVTPVPGSEPTMPVPAGAQIAGATAQPSATTRPADGCGAGRLQARVGKPAGSDPAATIKGELGHEPIRVIRPGEMVTMDHRPDRLNIELGEDGRIKAVRCG